MHLPKVLIVNDDVHSAVALKSTLSQSAENKFDIVLAYSGEEALRRILRDDFAVILLDVKMPTMDGFETADAIHSHPRLASLPIIFITAHYDEELHRLYGYQKGAVDYVFMPVNPKILRTKVAVFVEMARQKLALEAQNQELHAITDNLRVRRLIDVAEMATQIPPALDERAARDPLTGVRNQQLMTEYLEYAVRSASRHQDHFALLIIEVGQSPHIDDIDDPGAGHDQAILVKVADCIEDVVRASDLVGRFKDDAFIVLLKGIAEWSIAQQVVDKLAATVNRTHDIAGQRIAITADIGMALFPENGTSPQELIDAAYRDLTDKKPSAVD